MQLSINNQFKHKFQDYIFYNNLNIQSNTKSKLFKKQSAKSISTSLKLAHTVKKNFLFRCSHSTRTNTWTYIYRLGCKQNKVNPTDGFYETMIAVRRKEGKRSVGKFQYGWTPLYVIQKHCYVHVYVFATLYNGKLVSLIREFYISWNRLSYFPSGK